MISDTILHKYMRHLRHIDQGSIVHLDAVELALRCALNDLDDWHVNATDGALTEKLGSANLRIMELQADLKRLQTDANSEVAELRNQLAQLDADNAALIGRNRELLAALEVATSTATPTNGNGTASNPPFVPPEIVPFFKQPQSLDLLDDEATDWWIGCDAGRHTWRTVPKPVQLRMVRHILSFGPESGAMKMTEFDAIKPDWMPTATSHTKTLNLSWQQLNDWRVEL